MKSNYDIIGNHVRLVNLRNKDLSVKDLRGLSMTKEFRKSTSNIVGTDMSNYKIVNKNQFACDFMSVIRVFKLPVVMHTEDNPVIVSPAYPVFEIIDENILLSEYLMMWMRRSEFDRYAFFKCDSAIRGGFGWKEFCHVEIPVPKIEIQKEIVEEYNTIINRIKLNNQLIQKCEETAQAIYKQWFVDFEFPDEGGKFYKSNRGDMEFNEVLDQDIPKGWSLLKISDWGAVITGKTPTSEDPELFGDKIAFVTPTDYKHFSKFVLDTKRNLSDKGKDNLNKKILEPHSILFTCIGSDMGKAVINMETCITNQQINSISPFELFYTDYLYYYLISVSSNLKSMAMSSSTMPMLNKTDYEIIKILKPKDELLKKFNLIMEPLNQMIWSKVKLNKHLQILREILLSKMSQIEPIEVAQ
jgi:type I restriction enzyme, S subunit